MSWLDDLYRIVGKGDVRDSKSVMAALMEMIKTFEKGENA